MLGFLEPSEVQFRLSMLETFNLVYVSAQASREPSYIVLMVSFQVVYNIASLTARLVATNDWALITDSIYVDVHMFSH
jgi:hypothetical protein